MHASLTAEKLHNIKGVSISLREPGRLVFELANPPRFRFFSRKPPRQLEEIQALLSEHGINHAVEKNRLIVSAELQSRESREKLLKLFQELSEMEKHAGIARRLLEVPGIRISVEGKHQYVGSAIVFKKSEEEAPHYFPDPLEKVKQILEQHGLRHAAEGGGVRASLASQPDASVSRFNRIFYAVREALEGR
jgi:hypothetical protein